MALSTGFWATNIVRLLMIISTFTRLTKQLHIRIHIAEGTFVVAAAQGYLKQQRISLVGRSVDNPSHIHAFVSPCMCAIYSFPQVSIAATTG